MMASPKAVRSTWTLPRRPVPFPGMPWGKLGGFARPPSALHDIRDLQGNCRQRLLSNTSMHGSRPDAERLPEPAAPHETSTHCIDLLARYPASPLP